MKINFLYNPEILFHHLKGSIMYISKDLAVRNVLHITVYNRLQKEKPVKQVSTPTHTITATKINQGGGVGTL